MNEIQVFGVAIRVIGLLSAGRGLMDAAYVFFYSIGALETSVTKAFPTYDLVYGVIFLFGGLYLLRGSPVIVDYAFPNRNDGRSGTDQAERDQNNT